MRQTLSTALECLFNFENRHDVSLRPLPNFWGFGVLICYKNKLHLERGVSEVPSTLLYSIMPVYKCNFSFFSHAHTHYHHK